MVNKNELYARREKEVGTLKGEVDELMQSECNAMQCREREE